jgi:PAS domain S-box-containing protein
MASPIVGYWVALASLAVAILLRWAFDPLLGDSMPIVMLSGAVAVTVWAGGYRPALMVAISGYLICLYYFVEPRHSFQLDSARAVIGSIAYVAMCSIIIVFGENLRRALRRWRDEQQKTHATLARLQESEDRFRRMCDSAPVLIWVSGEDNLCTWFNKQWLEFVGQPMEHELGNGWTENLYRDDVGIALETYRRAFESRAPFTMEYRLKHHSGEYRWVLDKGLPLYGANNEFVGYIGSCVDMEDHKRSEQILKDADRRKDEFLATLSHELRAPLAPIRNALHVLGTKQLTDDDFRWSREVINRQVANMSRLMEDLLDVSRVSQNKIVLHKTRITLGEIIDDAVTTFRSGHPGNDHVVDLTLPMPAVHVEADAMRLAQAIGNLLDNAAKYSPEGTSIELRCKREKHEVVICVRDHGMGIAPEMMSGLFQMFSHTASALERSNGGLGVGLALTRRIIDLHGGSIEAHSGGIGEGSEFIVRIPIVSDEKTIDIANQAKGKGPDFRKHRILVADDSQDSADSLSLLLSIAGHEVRTAYAGKDAIDLLPSFQPTVALLDIGMPIVSGLEVCKHIRNQPWGKKVTVIAQTGWGRSEDRDMTTEAGFDYHLVKPVQPQKLLEILNTLE